MQHDRACRGFSAGPLSYVLATRPDSDRRTAGRNVDCAKRCSVEQKKRIRQRGGCAQTREGEGEASKICRSATAIFAGITLCSRLQTTQAGLSRLRSMARTRCAKLTECIFWADVPAADRDSGIEQTFIGNQSVSPCSF